MRVELTKFTLPRGQRSTVYAEISDDLKPQLDLIKKHGLHLETELLSTDMVSTTLSTDDDDYDIVLCPNLEGKPRQALEAMLKRFDEAKFLKWKELTS